MEGREGWLVCVELKGRGVDWRAQIRGGRKGWVRLADDVNAGAGYWVLKEVVCFTYPSTIPDTTRSTAQPRRNNIRVLIVVVIVIYIHSGRLSRDDGDGFLNLKVRGGGGRVDIHRVVGGGHDRDGGGVEWRVGGGGWMGRREGM